MENFAFSSFCTSKGATPYNGTWTQNNSAPLACNPCVDFGKRDFEDTKKTFTPKSYEKYS